MPSCCSPQGRQRRESASGGVPVAWPQINVGWNGCQWPACFGRVLIWRKPSESFSFFFLVLFPPPETGRKRNEKENEKEIGQIRTLPLFRILPQRQRVAGKSSECRGVPCGRLSWFGVEPGVREERPYTQHRSLRLRASVVKFRGSFRCVSHAPKSLLSLRLFCSGIQW